MKLFLKKLFRRPKPCSISLGVDPANIGAGVEETTIVFYCCEHRYLYMTEDEGCGLAGTTRYKFGED